MRVQQEVPWDVKLVHRFIVGYFSIKICLKEKLLWREHIN